MCVRCSSQVWHLHLNSIHMVSQCSFDKDLQLRKCQSKLVFVVPCWELSWLRPGWHCCHDACPVEVLQGPLVGVAQEGGDGGSYLQEASWWVEVGVTPGCCAATVAPAECWAFQCDDTLPFTMQTLDLMPDMGRTEREGKSHTEAIPSHPKVSMSGACPLFTSHTPSLPPWPPSAAWGCLQRACGMSARGWPVRYLDS